MIATLADHANPLLVRHLRQSLRSNAFFSVFLLLLAIATLATLGLSNRAASDLGPTLFATLGSIWSFALFVAVPMTTYQHVARERDEDTWDLIELTGMRPWSLVRGMFAAAMVQAMLHTAALVPFMVMAWLLGGIDLTDMALAIGGTLLISAMVSAAAIVTASLGPNKASRRSLGGLLALGLLIGWLSLLGARAAQAVFAGGGRRFGDDPAADTALTLGWLHGTAMVLWVCFACAASQLTFRADNRSTGPRLAWFACWCSALAWALVVTTWEDGLGSGNQFHHLGQIGPFLVAWSLVLGFFATTEDTALSPRQARAVLGGGGSRPVPLALFFGPGAARGQLFFLVMLGLSLGVALLPVITGHDHLLGHDGEGPRAGIALAGYGLGLLALGELIARHLAPSLFVTGGQRRVALLTLLASATIVPSVLGVAGGLFGLHLVNPFYGTAYVVDQPMGHDRTDISALLVALVAVAIAGAGIFAARIAATSAVRLVRVRARADDHNPRQG